MSGGGKGGKGSQVTGFRYLFGIHMGIGRGPVDEIVAAKVGGMNAWQGSITESGPGRIKVPELFGGEKKEGGVEGTFQVLMGEPTQDPTNAPVASILTAGVIPGFRRMVTIYFDGMISALNPYPKKWSWRVRRAVEGWDGAVLAPGLAIITLGGAPPTYITEAIGDLPPYTPPEWNGGFLPGGGDGGGGWDPPDGEGGPTGAGPGSDPGDADGDNSNGEA